MAIVKTDWGQYRDANSVIPPDIFFSVLRSSDNDEENIDLEVDKNNLLGAHKLLLAGSSEVFRANFFGLMKMNGEVMVVKSILVLTADIGVVMMMLWILVVMTM